MAEQSREAVAFLKLLKDDFEPKEFASIFALLGKKIKVDTVAEQNPQPMRSGYSPEQMEVKPSYRHAGYMPDVAIRCARVLGHSITVNDESLRAELPKELFAHKEGRPEHVPADAIYVDDSVVLNMGIMRFALRQQSPDDFSVLR